MASPTINGMNVKIDKSGRIVLPKEIRNRLRLRAGANLELEERPDGIMLRLVGQRPSMVQKDGFWVHMGKLPRGLDWSKLLDDDRDDRIKGIRAVKANH